jgi:drug/metabolite transporter (DMT)-like permease
MDSILGGVFFAVSKGMPTAIAALIVTLQPILTNSLSGPILGEKVSFNQWLGVILGFIGAAMVLGIDVGNGIPLIGFIATVISLIAITTLNYLAKKIE